MTYLGVPLHTQFSIKVPVAKAPSLCRHTPTSMGVEVWHRLVLGPMGPGKTCGLPCQWSDPLVWQDMHNTAHHHHWMGKVSVLSCMPFSVTGIGHDLLACPVPLGWRRLFTMMIHRVPPPTTSLLQVGLPMASPGVVPGLDTLGEVGGLVCPSTVGSWGLFGFPLAPLLGLGVSPTVWAWCLREHDREWALCTSGKLASQQNSPGM